MSQASLGNQLNRIINDARAQMFRQAELAQLTYLAFELATTEIMSPGAPETRTILFPVGMRPDQTTIPGERTYTNQDLRNQYQFLAVHQLSINVVFQLVSIVEAMLHDLLRAALKQYPDKLGSKKKIAMELVLEATSIEEIHERAIDTLLNEMAYESPAEFAESLQQYLSLNLMESPAFHKYMEVKATRDVYVHNRGLANKTYFRKCGPQARVQSGGQTLPVDTNYFLNSYEACLQLSEWLESQLHKRWESSDFIDRSSVQMEMPLSAPLPKPNRTRAKLVKKYKPSRKRET